MENGHDQSLPPLTESNAILEYDEPKVVQQLLDIMHKVKSDPKLPEPDKQAVLEGIVNNFLEKLPLQKLTEFAFGKDFNDPAFNMIDRTDLRRQIWDSNHAEISRCLHNFLIEHRKPPTRNQLAQATGLSRQTITNHLKAFTESESYKEERKSFKILVHRVLARVYESALEGNVRASRLYFEMVGELGNVSTKNYFIQFNNLRVYEETIKSLPPEKVTEIETIICKSLPQPKL